MSTQSQGRPWLACPLAGPSQAEVHMVQDSRGTCTAVLSPASGRDGGISASEGIQAVLREKGLVPGRGGHRGVVQEETECTYGFRDP